MRAKRGTGVVHGLRRFFEAVPEEELTYRDIAIKFGCSGEQARTAVSLLKRTLPLESVRPTGYKQNVIRRVSSTEAAP